MSSIVISGDTSGSVTVSVPAVSGSNTVTIPAVTGTVMVSSNMPAFSANLSANQSVSSGVNTKVALNVKSSTGNATAFDTNGYFDAVTNYRFTPLIAGYYQFTGCAAPYATNNTSGSSFIYKNGAAVAQSGGAVTSINGSQYIPVSTVLYMNGSTDYVELYGVVTGTASTLFASNSGTTAYLTGALIRTS
jgi:hypothetical protein